LYATTVYGHDLNDVVMPMESLGLVVTWGIPLSIEETSNKSFLKGRPETATGKLMIVVNNFVSFHIVIDGHACGSGRGACAKGWHHTL
jgi:hypothetical protein